MRPNGHNYSLDSADMAKIRTVQLKRKGNAPLGFSIRGGREHKTGIFISQVMADTEAAANGLKAGDQILRINGYPVDQFVHEEIYYLLKSQTAVTLKVKSVGLIPVKSDPVAPYGIYNSVPLNAEVVQHTNGHHHHHHMHYPPHPPPPLMAPTPSSVPPPPPIEFATEINTMARQLKKVCKTASQPCLTSPGGTAVSKELQLKQEQHEKLMMEFKEVHRKMFGNSNQQKDEASEKPEKKRPAPQPPTGAPQPTPNPVDSHRLNPVHETPDAAARTSSFKPPSQSPPKLTVSINVNKQQINGNSR